MRRTTRCAAAFVALAYAGALAAHHSISMFDLASPTWVKGTVLRYEPIAPHVMILLDEKKEDGSVRRLNIEGPNLGRLARIGVPDDFLRAGDTIEVCGFPFKEEIRVRNSAANSGTTTLPAFHAHLLVTPDGRMRSWGPYGKLDNCVRPNDRVQTWVDFLNADALARDLWCRSLSYVQSALLPPQAVVDEISGELEHPCG
jgi:hypothetical protein